ncbi:MAG TPA: pentapeptide repeat-containing protein [Nostocaceae cyanobacterium]|nr:pentapeptide repeat-containing protein [Kamptonema sp.]HLO85969.1 pentapeptide repeat-containing protein [Nostocaceae cyanobacterium]
MKALTIVTILALTLPVVAANPSHLERLKKTNSCVGCDLSRANLSSFNLAGANLRRANLSGAVMQYMYEMRNAVFDGANLNYANLKDSAFGWGSFVGASLVGINLDFGQKRELFRQQLMRSMFEFDGL